MLRAVACQLYVTCSSNPKKHKSNSITIVCYVKDSYVPCGFQVMHEEGRKEGRRNEKEGMKTKE